MNLLSSLPKLAAKLGQKYFSAAQTTLPQNPQRILWIRLDHIGDGVMNVPALAALRARFPEARIDALILPCFAPLLESLHLVDDIIIGDSPRFPNKGRLAALRANYAFAKKAQSHYDLAIEARGDDVARLIAWRSKTPYRLGPDRIFYEPPNADNLSFLMTQVTSLSHSPRHAVINNLANLHPLGVTEVPFEWPLTNSQKTTIAQLLYGLKVETDFAVIQPRSNDARRDWPPQRFAEIADYLVSHHGLKVLLSGSGDDIDYNDHLKSMMKSTFAAHNIAGKVSLVDLPALFARAKIMVTVDTGPMHLAAMVKTPIVALMLPNLALRHYPWKQPAAAIAAPNGDMQNITTEQVRQKVDAVLSG